MASVEDSAEVVCSRGVRLVADTLISELPSGSEHQYDAIALPVRSSNAANRKAHEAQCIPHSDPCLLPTGWDARR